MECFHENYGENDHGAAASVVLFAQVQAAELESGFLGMKWATRAKDLKGFTKTGASEKIKAAGLKIGAITAKPSFGEGTWH